MDKLRKLYNLYIEKGLLTDKTTFEQFASASDDVQNKLHGLGKSGGLFETTDENTFKTAWAKEPEPIAKDSVPVKNLEKVPAKTPPVTTDVPPVAEEVYYGTNGTESQSAISSLDSLLDQVQQDIPEYEDPEKYPGQETIVQSLNPDDQNNRLDQRAKQKELDKRGLTTLDLLGKTVTTTEQLDALAASKEPQYDYKPDVNDEVEKTYANIEKELPRTELNTIDFGNTKAIEEWQGKSNNIFWENNETIQKEIIPNIEKELKPLLDEYSDKAKIKYNLTDLENIKQEDIDAYTKDVNKYYNGIFNTKLITNKKFKGLTKGFNDVLNEKLKDAHGDYIMGEDSPNLYIANEIAKGSPFLSENLMWGITKSWTMMRGIHSNFEKAGVNGSLQQLSAKIKHNDAIAEQAKRENWDDGEEGFWVVDPSSQDKEYKFMPKYGSILDDDGDFVETYKPPNAKEGTWGEFQEEFKKYSTDRDVKHRQRFLEIQQEDLKLRGYDKDAIGNLLKGNEVLKNGISLAFEQVPQMALAIATLGASSGLQMGASIYSDGVENEARERFNIKPEDDVTIEQKKRIFLDDNFMDKLGVKAVAGGYVGGQLERLSAGRLMKPFITTGVKAILRGGFANSLKRFANNAAKHGVNAVVESVTEISQETIQAAASGADADPEQIWKAGATGLVVSLMTGLSGNILTQTLAEVRSASRIISGKLNPESVEAYFNYKIRDIDIAISKEGDPVMKRELSDKRNALLEVRNANSSIPRSFTSEGKAKAVDLISEKKRIEKSIEGKDKSLIVKEVEKVKAIEEKLEKLTESEAVEQLLQTNIGNIEKIVNKVEGIRMKVVKDGDAVKALAEEQGIKVADINEAMAADGFKYTDKTTGEQVLVVNKETAKSTKAINVASHEFLHAFLKEASANSPEVRKSLGTALGAHLLKIDRKSLGDSTLAARLLQYSEKPEDVQYEEVLTLFSDALISGDIAFSENVFTKIGDVVRRALQTLGIKGVKLDTGKDVYNFIRDYNRSVGKGKLNIAQKKAMKVGLKGKLTEVSGEELVEETDDAKMWDQFAANGFSSVDPEMDAIAQEIADEQALKDKKEEDEVTAEIAAGEEIELERLINLEEAAKKDDNDDIVMSKSETDRLEELRNKVIDKTVAKEIKTNLDEEVVMSKSQLATEEGQKEYGKRTAAEQKAFNQSVSNKVQEMYEAKGRDYKFHIMELFDPIVFRMARRRKYAPNYNEEDLVAEIKTGARGLYDLIEAYDPEKGVPLAAYVNSLLGFRAIEASRRVLKEEFEEDIDQVYSIEGAGPVEEMQDPTGPDEREGVREKRIIKPSSLFPLDEDGEPALLEDAAWGIALSWPNVLNKNKSFKKLGDLSPETTADFFDVPIKKVVDPGANLAKGEASNAQRVIVRHADKLMKLLPNGAVLEGASDKLIGTSTGVPQGVLKAFYVKGRRIKKDQGLAPMRVKPDLTKDQFLRAFGIEKNKKSIKFSARSPEAQTIKGMMSLFGRLVTNEIVRTHPDIGLTAKEEHNIKAGKSDLMFSKGVISDKGVIPYSKEYNDYKDPTGKKVRVTDKVAKSKAYKKFASTLKGSSLHHSTIVDKPGMLESSGTNQGIMWFTPDSNFHRGVVRASEIVFANKDTDLTKPTGVLTAGFRDFKGRILPDFEVQTPPEVLDALNKKYQDNPKLGIEKVPDNVHEILLHPKADTIVVDLLDGIMRYKGPNEFATGGYINDTSDVVVLGGIDSNKLKLADTDKSIAEIEEQDEELGFDEYYGFDEEIVLSKSEDPSEEGLDPDERTPAQKRADRRAHMVSRAKAESKIKKSSQDRKRVSDKEKAEKIANQERKAKEKEAADNKIRIEVDRLDRQRAAEDKVKREEAKELKDKGIKPAKKKKAAPKKKPKTQTKKKLKDPTATTFKEGRENKPKKPEKEKSEKQLEEEEEAAKHPLLRDFDKTRTVSTSKVRPKVEPKEPVVIKKPERRFRKLKPVDEFGEHKEYTEVGRKLTEEEQLEQEQFKKDAVEQRRVRTQAKAQIEADRLAAEEATPKTKQEEIRDAKDEQLHQDFNEIIEKDTKIKASEVISEVTANALAKTKGWSKWFVSAQSDDFVGLLYRMLGKNATGNAQMAWFKKHLLDPYARAIEKVSQDRNRVGKAYKKIKKDLGVVPSKLNKRIPGKIFTIETAIRVYIWNQMDEDVEGLSNEEVHSLVEWVEDNPQYRKFADASC